VIEIVALRRMEGSGKSTVANGLKEFLGYPIVSTGNMLRDAAKNDVVPPRDESLVSLC